MIKRTKLEMLSDYMTGLNTMIDAAGQMVHQRCNPKWIAVRDILNLIKDRAEEMVKSMDRK